MAKAVIALAALAWAMSLVATGGRGPTLTPAPSPRVPIVTPTVEVLRTSTPLPSTPPATPVGRLVSSCTTRDGLADPACTPGALDPRVTQENLSSTICSRGYTASVRPPLAYTTDLKREGLRLYHLALPFSAVEEDHLVPLELGGHPTDPANLWPEPRGGPTGAEAKDQMENDLNHAVCRHQITLAEAQRIILERWVQPR